MTQMQKTTNKINPIKHSDQRVGVFIDVQNMYYSAKNLHGKKVNFGKIVEEAVAGRKLIRAIAYVVRTESQEEQPFFEALYNLGIETREKDLKIFQTGTGCYVYKPAITGIFKQFIKSPEDLRQ